MRYDVSNDMWFKMPSMITGRYCPGVFISKGDNRFLYAFGGLVSTIERIDVGGIDNIKKWWNTKMCLNKIRIKQKRKRIGLND